MSSLAMEEYDLMKDSKYRVYVSAVDKALKNFEYTSEWADLISALGKLNKVLSSHTKFQVIPRRIKISKRLAQCMHPALPAGVHLRALETYDAIFKCMGTARLSSELFIYSAGLFPLLGHAAMNVRPPLLTVYETHFVPLGKRLGPALSGFLSGVLPGLEEGSDHFERTNALLEKVCEGVGAAQFYTCLWECLASNAKIRLPAISYILVHSNRAEDKLFIMGINTDVMVGGLSACVLDSSVLVQRCALDLLLVCFPMHNNQLNRSDTVRLMTAALSTLLRRDMSLNRRLFGWLLGSEVNIAELHGLDSTETYFQLHSREILVEAIRCTLSQVVVEAENSVDFRPYRLLVVLLDRPDIGPVVLDDILYDVFRSLYHARSTSCSVDHHGLEILQSKSSSPIPQELFKAINLLFNSLEPAYIWQYAAEMIGKSFEYHDLEGEEAACVQPVGSGPPKLSEVCWLIGCLMDATSLETYMDTTCQHLPLLFLQFVSQLTTQHDKLSPRQLATCLKLAAKILSRVQPPPPPPRIETSRQRSRAGDAVSQSSDGSQPHSHGNPLQRSRDLSLSENHLEAEAALKVEHTVNRSASADARLDMIRSKTPDCSHVARSDSLLDDDAIVDLPQPTPTPTLEQCREQYKELFVALVGNSRMIDWGSMNYSVLFNRLHFTGPAVDGQCSLEHLLQHCLGEPTKSPKSTNEADGAGDIVPQLEALLEGGGVEWEEVLRLACSLLVDLSAFPSFNKISPSAVEVNSASDIPPWLQILAVCSCWLGRTAVMQLTSIATLLDLIATVSSTRSVQTGASSGSVVPVILAPLLEASHVNFIEHKTHVLQVVARWLWHHLGASSILEGRCVSLLQQLHDCTSSCEAVESAIAESLGQEEPRNQLEAFQRFATLWHASRDLPTKGCHHRPFQKSLLRMLDNLWLDECGPLRLTAQGWLLHSLLRGDAARFLDPLLLPLLSPTTARVSVLRVTVRLRSTVQAARIYAISTLDGSVIYHVSPFASSDKHANQGSSESDPVRAKRIFAVKSLSRRRVGGVPVGVPVVGATYTDLEVSQSSLHSWALPSINGSDSCLLVSPQFHQIPTDPDDNRGGSSSSSSSNISTSSTTATGSLSKEESLKNGLISRLHVADNSTEGSTGLSVSVRSDGRLVLDGPYSQKLYSGFEEGDDEDSDRLCSSIGTECDNAMGVAGGVDETETELDESFSAEDYFNKVSSIEGGTEEGKREAKGLLGLHPIHSHMLLYCGVYDSARTLYALRTLRNALATNPRAFLTCAATTGVPKASSELLTLLARHRKSVFGHNFHGDVGSSSSTTRSHMYLEVLISACLYLTRAYYPSLGQTRLTTSEVIGNQQVQVASLELLTLVMSELTGIVRDSGHGLANYLADLLARCKVQKVVLHCLVASVHDVSSSSNVSPSTFTEEIVRFNDPGRPTIPSISQPALSPHTEAFQIQLLRLLLALIILEHQVKQQKGTASENTATGSNSAQPTPPPSIPTTNGAHSDHPEFKYLPGRSIPQQPMFLAAILSALMMQGQMCWLHQHWTTLVTCALPFMGPSLARVVLSVVRQLCENLRSLTPLYLQPVTSSRALDRLPVDYTVTQLEALTVLVHYCLLDKGQQPANSLPLLNSKINGTGSSTNGLAGVSQTAQIFNNLAHVFLSTPLHQDAGQDSLEPVLASRNALLFNLPQILACTATLWHAVSSGPDRDEWQSSVAGSPRIVRRHLLEFLSPISLHHSTNFLAAVAVVWHDRRRNNVVTSPSLPVAPPAPPPLATCQITQEQKVLVQLLGAIRVMPIDTLVKTLQQVLKSPPAVHGSSQTVQLEVSSLELLLAYLREASPSPLLSESWSSVLALLKDGLQPGLPPPVSLLLLSVLNEFVQLCQPSLPERRDLRDLQDITAKLVEACKDIMQTCLEQAAFMRRQYVVKEDQLPPANHVPTGDGAAQFVVQTQQVLAEQLASLLDVTFGSQEKERVIDILCSLMTYVTPFLRLHTSRNAPCFNACSALLASITSFQYTRRAWRREVLDLLLDSAMFQMEARSLRHWRTIVDNLMTHDTATFRDLLGRVTVSQGNSLGIFSNREQEYEQRAQVLKRLAFVILCSDMDQYQKYMPDIQEKLAESLRLPQVVPAVQANVFLCFRVLLLRMSQHHVTSLWPVIISEMVQVFLQMEQELSTDSEQFSSHIRLMSGLDLSWVSDRSNGLHARGHPHWLHLQLATVQLLYLSLHLPADHLPQFQMYRWAFVGNNEPIGPRNEDFLDEDPQSPNFVPHVTRIARLMDSKFEGPVDLPPGSTLLPSNVAIRCLQELHPFFSALSGNGPQKLRMLADSHVSLSDLEKVLEADFLDAMPNK